MAKRKPFKRDSVGRARLELKVAQERHHSKPSRRTKAAVVSAEKALLRTINVRKKRPQGKV